MILRHVGVASRTQNVIFWAAQLAADHLVLFQCGGTAGSICTLVLSVLIWVCDAIRPTCLPWDCLVHLSVSTQHLRPLFWPMQTTRETHEEIWS